MCGGGRGADRLKRVQNAVELWTKESENNP